MQSSLERDVRVISSSPEGLVGTIRPVGKFVGTCYKCGEIADKGRLCRLCKKPRRTGVSTDGVITFREKQIIGFLVAGGALNKEIAFGLRLTEGTIKEYLCRLFKKTGVRSRTELAVRAAQGEFPYILPTAGKYQPK